jgi:hypothetical protein
MITTDFNRTINKEDIENQRYLFQKAVGEKYNLQRNDNFEFDDKFSRNGKDYFIEYKMDLKAGRTGNMVLELITSVYEEDLFIKDVGRWKLSQEDKNIVISNIDKYKKLSRHYVCDKNFFFFYTIKNENGLFESLLFKSKKLADFFLKTYKDKYFILTKTKRDGYFWYTISVLYPKKELIYIADRYYIDN